MKEENKKIPKIIHYFWFGNNPLPDYTKECIKTWEKYLPGYEIKEWNENNFNVNQCQYCKEAYKAGKWAFVSDYARFKILEQYGGIYLDTDVKLIRPLDGLIKKGPFMAKEKDEWTSIAPGLGMGMYAHDPLVKKIVNDYENSKFIKSNGLYDLMPVGERIVKKFLVNDGLKNSVNIQRVDNIIIYPKDYFAPYDYLTGKTTITSNTVAIHLYASSWLSDKDRKYHKISQKISSVLGVKFGKVVEVIIRIPYTVSSKYKKIGFKETFKYYIDKFR